MTTQLAILATFLLAPVASAQYTDCNLPTIHGPNGEVAPCPSDLRSKEQPSMKQVTDPASIPARANTPQAVQADSTRTAPSHHTTDDPTAYTFKSFHLGMGISDFKMKGKGEQVWIATKLPNEKGKMKTYKGAVDTPLCTDELDDFPGSNILGRVPEEVICNVSPGNTNLDQNIVAGGPVGSIIYRFYQGWLYEIDMRFASIRYPAIRSAFKEKYGLPHEISTETFQNGFGAHWTGEDASWQRSGQSIFLREGEKNGPGQDDLGDAASSIAVFKYISLAPPSVSRSNVDF